MDDFKPRFAQINSDTGPTSPQRRIKIQPQDVVLVPELGAVMTNAINLIANEIAHYAKKTARGLTLDLKEARVVKEYVLALVSLSRENREQARSEDLSKLSNEELAELAMKLINNKNTPVSNALTNNNSDKNSDEEDGNEGIL